MSSLYQFQEKDGLQIDTLTDEEAGLRILVNRRGAESVSLARRGAGWQMDRLPLPRRRYRARRRRAGRITRRSWVTSSTG